ncbi:beta-2-microglobulin-like [Astyanax mexicanus]|uniref:beta-2-microglobulin-like n=1 Tax=Astyanax mexicanus TaxID=7994 RepID=UPI0020CAF31C|nr:beta-2-microglobulin-like [Astyanax mexicanus]
MIVHRDRLAPYRPKLLDTGDGAPPAVHLFAKKSVRDSRKLTLTCLITGFYPKNVKMSLRKFGTSLPERLITSSGIRPNDDGTYQLRESVEISGDDPADYYCYVSHSSLTEPEIKKWVKPKTGAAPALNGGVVGGVIVILLSLLGVFSVLRCKRRRRWRRWNGKYKCFSTDSV